MGAATFFLLFPAAELLLLIKVGATVGALATVGLVLLGIVVGVAVIRYQGLHTLLKAYEKLQRSELPAQEMFEGLLIALGGILLVMPGFISDAVGILLLIPMLRRFFLARVISQLGMRFTKGTEPIDGEFSRETGPDATSQSNRLGNDPKKKSDTPP